MKETFLSNPSSSSSSSSSPLQEQLRHFSTVAGSGPSLRLAVEKRGDRETSSSSSIPISSDAFDYFSFLKKKSESIPTCPTQKETEAAPLPILSLKWNVKQDFLGSGRDAKVYRASVIGYQSCSYFSSLPSRLALKWLLNGSDSENEAAILNELKDEPGVIACFGYYHSSQPSLFIRWWQETESADNFIQIFLSMSLPSPSSSFLSKTTKSVRFLLLEYAPCGSLHSYSSRLTKRVEQSQLVSWLIQSLTILKQLHAVHHLIHFDIKPHNLFLFDHDRIKFGDFSDALLLGSVVGKTESPTSHLSLIQGRGSLPYTPPESLQLSSSTTNSHHGNASDAAMTLTTPSTLQSTMEELTTSLSRIDIYGLGVTFYTLMTGHDPFQNIQRNNIQMILAIRKGFMASGENPWPESSQRANGMGKDAFDLEHRLRLIVEKMTAKDPRSRPTVDQILNELHHNIKNK